MYRVMKFRLMVASIFILTSVLLLLIPVQAVGQKVQMFPLTFYRTGPYAPGGSGAAGGLEDWLALTNLKGGVEGVKLEWEECETAYDTARGVECYERYKDRMIVVFPHSTGLTYALLDRSAKDKIPIVPFLHGRADCAYGSDIFPYAFPLGTSYWSQVSAKIRYIAMRVGGEEKLKGVKIANLHIDIPYGQETIPMLNILSKKFGFEIRHFPVPPPGLEQSSQWLDIARRYKANWVINRNWGVSCTVPLREAARVGFPMDRILGVWWCGSEEDVLPAGKAAKGYLSTAFHGAGTDYPAIQEILEKVHGAKKGNIDITRVGTVFYNRGICYGIIATEALRTAIKKFGFPITGEQMKWALENLNITDERLKELGVPGLMPPLKTSPTDHEGSRKIRIQQWDGTKWVSISDWIPSYEEIVWEEVVKSARKYAKEKGIKYKE
jgi:branched-chain amino acid transport system substrate-binding protein